MKKILFMFSANAKHFKTMAIWIHVLAAMPTFSYGQDAAILTPNSPLLAPVDKSNQDSVIKRIKMDLSPDVEHYRNTYQRYVMIFHLLILLRWSLLLSSPGHAPGSPMKEMHPY